MTLELLYLPGMNERAFEELGEATLCAAIELINTINALRDFAFLSTDFVQTFNSTLFTEGQLVSALLNLAIQRMDAYYESVLCWPPAERPAKLLQIEQVLSDSLGVLNIMADPTLLKTLLLKVAANLLYSTDWK